MPCLLLLRHAKASPSGKDSDDHERALTGRGRADAATMGAWLHTNGYAPELVLCSDSARTVETWEIVAPELDTGPRVEFLEELYLASAKRIQAVVREAGHAETVMVIGHNPGMEDCAVALAREPADENEAARVAALRGKFPTCALAILEFDVADWADMAPAGGILAEFVKPKELK